MAMFYQAGEKINYKVTGTSVAYHELITIGAIVAVTTRAAQVGEVVACDAVGVFQMDKAAGAIEQGAKVYLDSDNKITTTAESNTYCGVAWEAAANSDTVCLVKINA